MSQYSITVTCHRKCDVRITDRRVPVPDRSIPKSNKYPRVAYVNRDYGKAKKFVVRFPKPLAFNRAINLVYGTNAVRNDVSIFVVPGCNCLTNTNPDLKVTANQANTTD